MDLEEQYDRIYRYCYFKVRHRQLAEDLTQETFLRFFKNIGYRESGQAIRILYTIARNLCIDEFRRPVADSLPEEPEAEQGAALEENLVLTVSIKTALERLDEEGRELILLRYVDEIPVGDIARIMNMSRFSVLRRTKKYIHQLKELLGGEFCE